MIGSGVRDTRQGPYGRSMADGEVFVIDRVVTRPGCARRFVDIL